MIDEEPTATQSAIGSLIAQAQRGGMAIASGGDVNIEALIPPPRPIEAATLQAAYQQLAKLPLDRIPNIGPLPALSFFPQTSPNPNVYFVGRSFYLHSLAKILKDEPRGSGPMRGAILTGIGGLGKTQLATEFFIVMERISQVEFSG